jgi:cytochrome c biogenesis protein CcmG, thiol:disulfide interchange protein DsbE
MTDDQSKFLNHPPGKKMPIWIIALIVVLLSGFLAILAQSLRLSGSGPLSVGQSMPDFTITTFDNETITAREMKGKVVVVNFWASWCKPCEQEASYLNEAWKQYGSGGQVIFLGIDHMDTEPDAKRFLQAYNVSYPNGPDLRSLISNKFRLLGVPETYVFDRQGSLAHFVYGPFSSVEEINRLVDPLLK